ncbi:SprT family zinc-dependent metalloprotease [Tumidithrix helvetica PCC 7403]|uniref:M48 family metallopeptidase n=1 Tax=Tumidithrix helvetica TaxID=3457545 RepID=UPI003C8924E2
MVTPKLPANLTDLPEYQLRVSPKAKHMRLSVSVDKGLEVVVPENFDRRRILEFLVQKRTWIDKALQQVNRKREYLAAQSPDLLPETIYLGAIAETWQVEYSPASSKFITAKEQKGQKLIVTGNVENIEAGKALLRQWLNRKAQKELIPWLRKVSVAARLPYRQTSVRGQKTLWASCSSSKNISLNFKLLFLEPDAVNYVFIHELCHTVHMNHSAKFWALVSKYEPNYLKLDRSLNQAWQVIPAWV